MPGVYNDDGSLRINGVVTPTPSSGFTQSVVSVPATTSTRLANTGESIYAIMNIGTGNLNLNFNATAVADSGLALNAASAVGRQGGSISFETPVTLKSPINGFSTAGTTVVVLKG